MKKLILMLLCIISGSCLAQEVIVNVDMFSVKDGMSDRSVFGVTQDDRGLIWVATGNGLNRFDGSEFKRIEDTNSWLSSGVIFGVQKDKFGKLWIQKNGEPVITFDPLKEQLLPLPLEGNLGEESFKILNQNPQGSNIFLKNENGKVFYLNESEKIVPFGDVAYDERFFLRPTDWHTLLVTDRITYKTEEIDKHGAVQNIYENKIGVRDIWEPGGNFLRLVFRDMKGDGKLSTILRELKKSGDLAMPIDLKKDGRSLTFKDLLLLDDNYLGLTKDSKGNIWFSANEKLWLFDPHGNFIKDLSSELLELTNGILFKVNHLFIDDEDRLWLSTGLGLFVVQVKDNPFQNYLTEDKETSVRGITKIADDRLLAFTYSGTKVIDENTNKVLNVKGESGLGLSKDNKGNLWVGLHYPAASVVNEKDLLANSVRMTKYLIENGEGVRENIPFFDQLSGEVYLGSNNGLFIYNEACSCFKPYSKNNDYKKISKKSIPFFYANEEAIWLATNNGIYQLDREQGIVNNFQFPYNYIKHIHEDAAGDFWMATGGGGLIHWNRKEDIVKQFTVKDGLSHNVLYAVYEDAENKLWLPSNNGLMCFNKSNGEVAVFQTEDGIAHEEFNTYSHYQGKDGRLYFGGLSGITSFHPEEIKFKENNAPFLITDVQQFDSETGRLINKTQEVQESNQLTLNSGDKFFTIGFSLLDYFGEHIYAWKMEGLEDEWNHQTENSLRINALPYGKHRLLIKAKGEGGKWAKNKIAISIFVQKPFYLRWEFIAFAVGLLALFIYGYIKLRLLRLVRTKEKLKGLVKERTAELSEKNKELENLNQFKDKIYSIIAHDLRAPAFALQDIGKKIDYLTKTKQFDRLQDFGDTVDESITTLNILLDNLLKWANQNLESISVLPEQLNVSDLLNQSIKELRYNIDKKGITINQDIDNKIIAFADKQTVLTISRNLLANAIKFSHPNGSIHLSATQVTEKSIAIYVKDNGVGINADRLPHIFDPQINNSTTGTMDEKGTGLGLGVSKELALLNDGDLEVASISGEGSTFSIILPSGHGV